MPMFMEVYPEAKIRGFAVIYDKASFSPRLKEAVEEIKVYVRNQNILISLADFSSIPSSILQLFQ